MNNRPASLVLDCPRSSGSVSSSFPLPRGLFFKQRLSPGLVLKIFKGFENLQSHLQPVLKIFKTSPGINCYSTREFEARQAVFLLSPFLLSNLSIARSHSRIEPADASKENFSEHARLRDNSERITIEITALLLLPYRCKIFFVVHLGG